MTKWYHALESRGHTMEWWQNMKGFGISWICSVNFLHKSTDFHDMQMECQRILSTAYFHKFLAIAKATPSSIFVTLSSLPNIYHYHCWDDIHKEERGNMILVVVTTLVLTHTFKRQMISPTTVGLIWFGKSLSLPLRYAKAYLRMLDERLMS